MGRQAEAAATEAMMNLAYSERGDAAYVEVDGPIPPDRTDAHERLDADRSVRYDADGRAIGYAFLNARRYGVRLDDLAHPDELRTLFREAGFAERDWGHAIPTNVIRRRRTGIAG
jgi:hypothetical protein